MNKIFKIIFILLLIYLASQIYYLSSTPVSKTYCQNIKQKSKQNNINYINDVSCLNQTKVTEITKVKSIDDIKNAIDKAKKNNLHISIAGELHSMGGQSFYKDAIILDMLEFNKILELDETNKIIKVQSGATWHQIQNFINDKNLAIKSMQSSDIFTIGGSISVNAHGMDHRFGSIYSTIKSMNVMLESGNIVNLSKENNSELFNLVVGGYGLFGIILDAEIELTDNVLYKEKHQKIKLNNFLNLFEKVISNKDIELFYAHLSSSPLTFMKNLITYEYIKLDKQTDNLPKLNKVSLVKLRRSILNLSKIRWYGQIFKWLTEKYIDPIITKINNSTIISRNQIMHDSVEYLQNILPGRTDILQEYFVPRNKIIDFINKIREVLQKSSFATLNCSIRVVNKEHNFLNYAPTDMFAIVLYINTKTDSKALESLKKITKDLINISLSLDGTFFLPYQLYFTKEQLVKAYPNIEDFFSLKRKYDPELLFMNKFYKKYA